jgi:voltage-gated potassium channel Kch
VTGHRIRGAIVTYLLIGLVFSLAYSLIDALVPGSFAVAGSATTPVAGGAESDLRWVYYSLVTLTTLGYGDITPISELARRLAVLEALIGQLFVAVLIARLVSLEIAHRKDPS